MICHVCDQPADDGHDHTWADVLAVMAPYCAHPADGYANFLWRDDRPKCPARPHASCMCMAKPDHEYGQVEHHICQCGRAWTSKPRRPR